MKVVWLNKARLAFIKTATYVKENFGEKAALELLEEVDENNVYLARNPYMCKKEPLLEEREIEYRSMLVKKLNKIIYRIDDELVTVVDFWNMRQNPQKMQDRVK